MNGDFLVNPVEIVRDGEAVALGALMSSGQIVVEWKREAFPEGERTDAPTLSIYRNVPDAEEATGGSVEIKKPRRPVTDGGQPVDERQADALEAIAEQSRVQNAVTLELAHELTALRRLQQGDLPHEFSAEGKAGAIEDRALELTERVDLDAVDTFADSDLMTDGGVLKSRSSDTDEEGRGAYDPEDLPGSATPAFLQRNGLGNELVADYHVLDSGWVRVTEWDGERVKFPPHKVQAVREVTVERYGERGDDGLRSRRLADEDLIETAREKGGASA